MPDRLPLLYWDTCIFLEHVKDEFVDPAKKRAVLRYLQENKDQKNRIITSVLTHVEALPRKLNQFDALKEEQYWSYFNGVYFIDTEVTKPVIALSREIRDFYYREANVKTNEHHRMLGLADAIHIATAIVSEVDEFHTRDCRGRGGNIGLLKLNQLTDNRKIAGRWPLNILSQEDPQGDILDNLTPPKKDGP